jgi:hypothetical protein
MTTTQLITIASVAAVVVSALAIAASLKSVRDQLRVTVFLTYTDRYARIMSGIPFEARQPGSGYRLASRPDDERIRVLGAFREYFNLCSVLDAGASDASRFMGVPKAFVPPQGQPARPRSRQRPDMEPQRQRWV